MKCLTKEQFTDQPKVPGALSIARCESSLQSSSSVYRKCAQHGTEAPVRFRVHTSCFLPRVGGADQRLLIERPGLLRVGSPFLVSLWTPGVSLPVPSLPPPPGTSHFPVDM